MCDVCKNEGRVLYEALSEKEQDYLRQHLGLERDIDEEIREKVDEELSDQLSQAHNAYESLTKAVEAVEVGENTTLDDVRIAWKPISDALDKLAEAIKYT